MTTRKQKPMQWTQREPCATCPYRRETKRALWHKAEFDNLLEQNAREFGGAIFGCHSTAKDPAPEPCVGWLLDQKRHGVPSLSLRMTLIATPGAGELFEAISDDGLDLYGSVSEMVAANYPKRTKRSRRGD